MDFPFSHAYLPYRRIMTVLCGSFQLYRLQAYRMD